MSRGLATIKPNSFNEESRTFDIVFVTENPCPAYDWDIGSFNEILSCDQKNIRSQRSDSGLPFFDNHYPRNTMSQLGRCDNIRYENKQGIATVTLGARADDALVQDIKNGIISGISVGYRVFVYQQVGLTKPGSNEIPTFRAVDWEPIEISSAPVQADPDSQIRSQKTEGLNTVNIVYEPNNNEMTEEEKRALAEKEASEKARAIEEAAEKARLQNTPPEPEKVDISKVRKEATDENKKRLDAILLSTRAAKVDDTKAIEYFQSENSIEEIRQLIIKDFVKSEPAKPNGTNVTIGKEGIEKKRAAAENAILNRINPTLFKLEEGAREFRGYSIHEIAQNLAVEHGQRAMGRLEMAEMIFAKRDMSTSDLPLILENVMNKALLADYPYAPEFWEQIARQTSVNDFKVKSMYRIDSSQNMQEMPEGAEIKYGKLNESKSTISVKSYAEGLQFTRRMYVNDDLSALEKVPTKFALDWNTMRGDLVWGMLTANAGAGVKMDDTKTLFHADHGNLLTGAGSTLSDAGLTAAVLAFKKQTGIDGKRVLRIVPKILVVAPDLEVTARKLLFTINPIETANVNVWANSFTLVVEHRLSGNAWFLAADPNAIDALYYAYLQGNSGLRANRIDNFNTDSIDLAVRAEFGVQAIDYRGWLKSVGS